MDSWELTPLAIASVHRGLSLADERSSQGGAQNGRFPFMEVFRALKRVCAKRLLVLRPPFHGERERWPAAPFLASAS